MKKTILPILILMFVLFSCAQPAKKIIEVVEEANNSGSTVVTVALKDLSIAEASLNKTFDSAIDDYRAEVSNSIDEITINAIADPTSATIAYSVNGESTTSNIVSLNEGGNIISITVLYRDKTAEYSLIVTRQSSNGETPPALTSLTLTGANLTESFNTSTYNYIANAGSSSSEVDFSTITNPSDATVSYKNNGVSTTNPVSISEGDNVIVLTVSKTGTNATSTYIVKVKKAGGEAGSNANLSSLTLSPGVLDKTFNSNTLSYLVEVNKSVSRITINATAEDSSATVTGDGLLNLPDDSNKFDIVVTAEDRVTTKTYTITVNKVEKQVTLDSIIVTGSNSVNEGSDTTFTATAYYSDNSTSTTGFTWSSDNSSVATVTGGVVTGVSKGSTKIIATKDGKSGSKAITVKEVITDRIVLHVKNYTKVWAWKKNDSSTNYTGGDWDKRPAMTDEGGDWYGYTLSVTECKILFTDPGQTDDMDITAGEWWYKDNEWYDYNPEVDLEAPEVTTTPNAGPVEQTSLNVTLNVTDNVDDSPKAYYTTDGSTPVIGTNEYTGQNISVSTGNNVIKAIAVDADGNESNVFTFTFILGQDTEAPEVKATPEPGRYETSQNVTLTATDNKDTSPKMYYTTNGTKPTTSSTLYTNQTITTGDRTLIKVLAVDASGNEKIYTFSYYLKGQVVTERFDPRQESIYFLLTARWFDGDKSNSIGDQSCSYTEERAKDSNSGFTGPDDVSWRGDFKGLVEKMDYIKALGFTTIWITPVVQNRSSLCYHGYHGWDFTKEDARLVSPGYDFQRVVDEAHNRGMKICLDIVINHSGPFGINNFAELKYNTPAEFPLPDEWSSWKWDEEAYLRGEEQSYPRGWEYDGLTSAGTINGEPVPGYYRFPDVRPFTDADKAKYPELNNSEQFWYDTTMSYCNTIDGLGSEGPGSLDYEGYKNSERRMRGHNTGFPTGSGSFDNYPDAHFDSLHNHCPDLNIENPDVQEYFLNAYYRYIDMGVDMFRVDTVMHMHKKTLNEMYWPQLLERAEQAKDARGGADFFIFGEAANFVCSITDKRSELREQNYTWDNDTNDTSTNNHLLDGNNYRTPDYSKKAPNASSPYHVSVINMVAHNNFCNGHSGGYGAALGNDHAYNDATFMPWYADSHDYGPNKGETRYKGDFAALWSMLFTFRGIPVVYYGSETRFAQGKPNDWPTPGSSAGENMSLEKTGRSYYGPNLEGTVTATDFGEYTATGDVDTTLSHELSQHLMALNKIRLAVPALQMGQYSNEGHNGGWAGYKRRYTGTNKITGQAIDSYALVGVGSGTHSWTGILDGSYTNVITGDTVTASGGSISASASGSSDSALVVLVHNDLTTPAPGKIDQNSPFLQ